ncbi:alcohol oxidase [Aspergillus campestris IBT 28561]|uniref:Alcohol oxidase n=1 Tax=Aspergillus campestris (strain IBT 28561) TaxID=1392248 RepID=A0A2I1D561_ASPC2|nr:alcohol oxidase [Aspergillus campestris IBT 28561]PKY04998.1 alcohol oxidase [Aspergillus campestris IBT 28561]
MGENAEPARFLASRFDYIIVGGGTAGSVLAARLSEDATVKVGVLEAGKSRVGDAHVDSPWGISQMLSNPEYDWALETTPQAGTNGRVHHLSGGKMLGGSSGINFMSYCRPSAADIDHWGRGGIQGWTWGELAPYYSKAQCLEHDVSRRDDLGSIKTCLPKWDLPIEPAMIDALNTAAGTVMPSDPWYGNHLGFYKSLSTLDYGTTSEATKQRCPTRSYAASGYLAPVMHRKNLQVLDEATVCRVSLVTEPTKAPRARWVHFWYRGSCHRILATREIILCAGSLHSPHLLELSGIGDPDVLHTAGIPCQVALPDVGNNLREHPMASVTYHLQTPEDILPRGPTSHDRKQNTTACPFSLTGFLPYTALAPADKIEHTIANARSGITDTDTATTRTTTHLLARLQDPESAAVQLIGYPRGLNLGSQSPDRGSYSLLVIGSHPISHGSCHVQSGDPFAMPRIDPGILQESPDVDVLAAGVAFADQVFHSKHLVGRIAERAHPGPSIDFTDPNQAKEFVRQSAVAFNHSIGTCAMGYVVDDRLQVKGVAGLRVVDASVIPLHIDGNPVSTVYALAERASDLIREESRRRLSTL